MVDRREFSKILSKAGRNIASDSKDATNWFRDTAENVALNKKDPSRLFETRSSPQVGSMYLFAYDPKTKDTLPFWDSYPLVLLVEPYHDGFLGLNLHYLPPLARAQLMDALDSIKNNDKYNKSTEIAVSYRLLKAYSTKFAGYQNCIKRYLIGHVRSSFHYVNPVDWGKVVLLPLQKWNTNTNKKYAGSPPY